jgi:hypothetical protein
MKTASLYSWLLGLALGFTQLASAADTAFVKSALEKPILDADKAWQEVADYTEAREGSRPENKPEIDRILLIQ